MKSEPVGSRIRRIATLGSLVALAWGVAWFGPASAVQGLAAQSGANPGAVAAGLTEPLSADARQAPGPVPSQLGGEPQSMDAPSVGSALEADASAHQVFQLSPTENNAWLALNLEREFRALQPVDVAEDLTGVARQRAGDLAARGYFSHTSPDGMTALKLLDASGIPYVNAVEILGRTNASEAKVIPLIMAAFMRSPNHAPWVVTPEFNQVGIGVGYGEAGMKYLAIVLAER